MILVLDLDDTLYDENSFVISGFRSVAKLISPLSDYSIEQLVDWMTEDLMSNGRGQIFNNCLKRINHYSDELLKACIDNYRYHKPEIVIFKEAIELLNRYARVPKYLVTDGNPDVQNSKIDALKIRPHFEGIYPTWSFGKDWHKPSLLPFSEIARRENVALSDICYIADDPYKDFVLLNAVGASTVRVLTGRFKNVRLSEDYEAIVQINDLSQFRC